MARGFGKGRSLTKFSFTYEDYAQILGCSPAAARKHAQRGHFDPDNLLSVLEFMRDRLKNRVLLDEGAEEQVGPLKRRSPKPEPGEQREEGLSPLGCR